MAKGKAARAENTSGLSKELWSEFYESNYTSAVGRKDECKKADCLGMGRRDHAHVLDSFIQADRSRRFH